MHVLNISYGSTILQPIISDQVIRSRYSITVPGSRVMLSRDMSTCNDHVNYPTIMCHLIISNDNDFENKRETERL